MRCIMLCTVYIQGLRDRRDAEDRHLLAAEHRERRLGVRQGLPQATTIHIMHNVTNNTKQTNQTNSTTSNNSNSDSDSDDNNDNDKTCYDYY